MEEARGEGRGEGREGGESDVWRGSREWEGSRCTVRQREEEGGKVTLGTEEGKEAKFVWEEEEEEESHLEDSRADRRGGAVCHSKKRGRDGKKDKFDFGV